MLTKRRLIVISAMVIAVALIILTICLPHTPKLVLTNAKTGENYGSFPLEDGTFSVTFVHSVNKSPVSDIYEIRDGVIYMTGTVYYGFGAGVPDELSEGQKLTFGENGEMIISDMDLRIDDLVYVVGTVSDHILRIGNKETSLRDLCGRNSSVSFTVK